MSKTMMIAKPPALRQRIAQYLFDGATVADATRRFVADIGPEERDELLFRLAYNEVRITLRGRDLAAEKRVFGRASEQPTHEVVLGAITDLVAHSFPLPDGVWVAWLDATVADHRARADWQRSLAGACLDDAARHETAIEMIEQAGVTCLRELLPQ